MDRYSHSATLSRESHTEGTRKSPAIMPPKGGSESGEVGHPSLDISGHSSAQNNTRTWKPWDRQQKRVFHRSKSILSFWQQHNYTVSWFMLSSSPTSDSLLLSRHHSELRRRIERVWGFTGLEFFQVKTTEGHGVLHGYWAWKAPAGYRGRPFVIPQQWISEQWQQIHGASVVWIARMGMKDKDIARVTRYVVTQYLVNQEIEGASCLDGMSWSWKRTFGFPLVQMWAAFKDTYTGNLRVGLYEKWTQFLGGMPVRLNSGVFDVYTARNERGWQECLI